MARKILVVKTEILAGTPTKAGTSKASMPRMNMTKSTLNIAGRISGNVTFLKVVNVLDPAVRAASSKEVSMLRKAADIEERPGDRDESTRPRSSPTLNRC